MSKYKVDITGINTNDLKVLKDDEMIKLFLKYQNGDLLAKEDLINANLKLKNSIYANDVMTDKAQSFCKEDTIKEKMLDCIISAMCIISNKNTIILRDKYILDIYMNLLSSYMVLSNISKEYILELVNDINEKKIPFLYHNNMKNIFDSYLRRTIKNQSIVLNSENIDVVLKLVTLCHNGNENWVKNKRIINSHFSKYFSNLSEVELLALKKLKK